MNHLERMTARLEAHKQRKSASVESLAKLRGKSWRHVVPIAYALVAQCGCRCGKVDMNCPYFGREVDSEVD